MAMILAQQHLLDGYEAIALATRRMLEAARAADWHAFDARSRECNTWMERVERLGAADALLDADGRRRRMELLGGVLRDDAALRDLLQPWLGQVDRCLHGHPAA
jgi:flagellar protein FliT